MENFSQLNTPTFYLNNGRPVTANPVAGNRNHYTGSGSVYYPLQLNNPSTGPALIWPNNPLDPWQPADSNDYNNSNNLEQVAEYSDPVSNDEPNRFWLLPRKTTGLRRWFTEQSWLSQYKERSKRIDVISRLIFPIGFFVFNCIYWYMYMTG